MSDGLTKQGTPRKRAKGGGPKVKLPHYHQLRVNVTDMQWQWLQAHATRRKVGEFIRRLIEVERTNT